MGVLRLQICTPTGCLVMVSAMAVGAGRDRLNNRKRGRETQIRHEGKNERRNNAKREHGV